MTLRQPHISWADEELVRHCLEGNEAAWVCLIEKYKNLVYSIPARYQLPSEDAADVFQYVWTELYRDLSRIDRVGGLRKWLITTAARNSLLQKKRRLRTFTAESLDSDTPDLTPNVAMLQAEVEREQRVRDAVGGLPARCQKLVHMLFFEQPARPYSEIARELGLAEGSIGFIRGRCLKKLKVLLKEFGL